MKKILFSILLVVSMSLSGPIYAQEVDFSIIPKSDGLQWNEVQDIAKWGSVRENYNKKAANLGKDKDKWLANQINSGIMNWDTLLNYIVYLAKFIGQLWLLVAAFVLMYLGYEKAMKVFSFGDSKISMVIKGLIVIIWAYFIVKFLYNAFLS